MEFNDGTVMSRDNFVIILEDDLTANARYKWFVNGKHHVNFDLSDYEITPDNIRGTIIHEAYGHGVQGYSDALNTHHKAYFASIRSKYWTNTTLTFKKFTVNNMWKYYYNEVGYRPLPIDIHRIYTKYSD